MEEELPREGIYGHGAHRVEPSVRGQEPGQRQFAHHDPDPGDGLGASDVLPLLQQPRRDKGRHLGFWEDSVGFQLLEERIDLRMK